MSIEIISSTEPISAAADADLDKNKVVETKDESSLVDETNDDESESSDESENSDVEDENNDEQSESEDEKEVKPKKKGGFQKRIERFQRKVDEKDREIDFLKSQMVNSKQEKNDARTHSDISSTESKPKADDFESHSDFVEALTDWKVEQKISESESKKNAAKFKTEQQKNFADFQVKVVDFAKTNKDFHEVIEEVDDIPLSIGLQDAIITSEIGAKVMYELSKNRDELLRINKLSPLAQAREIGKLEAKFSVEKEIKQEKKQTSAAAPIKTIGTKTASIKKSIYDSNLSMSEYEALRNEQINARKRA